MGMDIPTPVLGGLPSPFDYRDEYAAAAALAAAEAAPEGPISIDLSKVPVLMQSKRPACVAHAAATLMMLYWYHRTGTIVRFSPRFIDAWMKTQDGLPLTGTGAYPRLSMRCLAKVGCATEDVLPNDVTLSDAAYRSAQILTPEVMANAAQYRIPGYVSVATDLQSTRRFMRAFGPLSMLMQIGEEWYTGTDGKTSYDPKKILPLRTPAVVISGHEVVRSKSEDPDLDTLRNEWSIAWGNGGDGTFHPSEWTPFIAEQWAIAEIPADATQLISALPAPSAFHYRWDSNLYLGMPRSEGVKAAQIALMILGFLAPVPADELGFYGAKTAEAVLKYQRARRIAQPSAHNIGPQTRAKLSADFAI